MSEFNVGDKVLATTTKGDTRIEGVLAERAGLLWVGASDRSVAGLKADGFDVQVTEPAVPTEPGYYHDKDGDPWRIVNDTDTLEPRYRPYTRLVPEGTELVAPRLKVVASLKRVQADLEPVVGLSTTSDVHHARAIVSNLIGELSI